MGPTATNVNAQEKTRSDRSFAAKKGRSNSLFFQPKLTVGSPNDLYEREADAMADKVMRMTDGNQTLQPKHTITPIQRTCAECEEEEERAQRKGSGQTPSEAPSIVHDVVHSGAGRRLDDNTRGFMENRFGYDFSSVKIHDNTVAAKSAQSINALAYTSGNNIVFNKGQYSPDTNTGRKLLAHELTHTLQQGGSGAPVQRSCTDGNCETCEGGWKTLRVTAFFRTRATRETMRVLRDRINVAKAVLANCCVRLLFDFDWRLLRGGGTFDWGGDATGANYSEEAEALGEGPTFSGARGIPMVVVDTVPGASAVTVTPQTDPDYTGSAYFALPVTHGKSRSIAHEIGHVAGILTHTTVPSIMDGELGTAVSEEYCNAVRTIAS